MRDFEAAGLAAIATTWGVQVLYTGAGLVAAELPAIRSDGGAQTFQGVGSTLNQTSFEIQQHELPGEPMPEDLIEEVESGERFRVLEPRRRDDVAAWLLIVELAE
jgi:hypothetical protein